MGRGVLDAPRPISFGGTAMIPVRLETAAGELVTDEEFILPFVYGLPKIVLWGERFFARLAPRMKRPSTSVCRSLFTERHSPTSSPALKSRW